MCGFVGFWHFNNNVPTNRMEIAKQMSLQLKQRGPDSSDIWCDDQLPFTMTHQRLSIRDLSIHGAQPMHSQCGRWVIAYNGEIYNCEQLAAELHQEGHFATTTSDTALLLAVLSAWGIEKTLQKINGMFAFALWDKVEKKLILARDRVGIKPLYWGFNRGVLYFGSQMKAFRPHPQWQPEINYQSVASYFRVNFIGGPQSIYNGISKLQPGYYLSIDRRGEVKQQQYWSLLDKAQHSIQVTDEAVLKAELHHLLKDAVKSRMVSDVPLGAFLSGGIDSSLVVSLMQTQSQRPIKTFSIGFSEAEYNEAQYAKQVAKHLGTEHHELYFNDRDAMNLIPELSSWYDEPFADSSQLPTLLLSKLTKEHVTVSLSGDGGDELFAGYNRYFMAYNIYKKFSKLPMPMRRAFASTIEWVKPQTWDVLARLIPSRYRPAHFGDKVHKMSKILKNSDDQFYRSLISLWQNPTELLSVETQEYAWPEIDTKDFIRKMQLLDTLTYLPDDILTKVDRASMAVSLEARVPLLDHRVLEYAFRIPQQYLIRQGKGKWILREILNEYVPNKLIDRPKMGFGIPVGRWLSNHLRDWAENLLSSEALENSGLNQKIIRHKWQEHLQGSRNWEYALWGVLMYQSWREKEGSR